MKTLRKHSLLLAQAVGVWLLFWLAALLRKGQPGPGQPR